MTSTNDVSLSWRGLSATVDSKRIVYDCDGYCKPGEMLAIMGPSGAGKTTLLSMLAKKADKKMQLQGEVFVNGSSFKAKDFHSFGAYIYQNDILHQILTVQETLEFSARLRIVDQEQAQQRVSQLLRLFELQKCSQTIVGGKTQKGVSGGQRKRVCIAVQMVSMPRVIILDQPTSGLDSYKAGKILNILKSLSTKHSCSIIFTIHQPSYLLYSKLDKLILLSKGQPVYQGKADGILPYMESIGIQINYNMSVCDFFMWQVSQWRNKGGYSTALGDKNYKEKIKGSILAQIQQIEKTDSYDLKNKHYSYAKSYGQMVKILLSREWTIYARSPRKFRGMIVNTIFRLVIIGLVFLNGISDGHPSTSIPSFPAQLANYFRTAQGTCFVTVTANLMVSLYSVSLNFPMEREIYSKENLSGMYSSSSYFLSKIVIELVSSVISSVIFGSVAFWIHGYTIQLLIFLKYILTLSTIALIGNSLGLLTGTLFQDTSRAAGLTPIIFVPLMMLSGMYARLQDIPVWISWMSYISPHRYGWQMLFLNQFGDSLYPLVGVGFMFDYKQVFGVTFTYWINLAIIGGLSGLFYLLSYIFLVKLTTKISV